MFVERLSELYMLSRVVEQVWAGVDGFWPNNAVEMRTASDTACQNVEICVCVEVHVKPTHVCASFSFLNAVSAGTLFVCLHQVAHRTTQPRR